eukprot:7872581-Pyramimonas_sp.AAC.1
MKSCDKSSTATTEAVATETGTRIVSGDDEVKGGGVAGGGEQGTLLGEEARGQGEEASSISPEVPTVKRGNFIQRLYESTVARFLPRNK